MFDTIPVVQSLLPFAIGCDEQHAILG